MAFDFKKEYKELYAPKTEPVIIDVPEACYIAVRGSGNPNEANGAYQEAIRILYAVAYTIKMSYKGEHKIAGFYEYVVPPLEGFWWLESEPAEGKKDVQEAPKKGAEEVGYMDKSAFNWISVIRLPEFVTKEEFDWAVGEASKKKKFDCSPAEYMTIEEGLCVQMLHTGSFDKEPETIAMMDAYIAECGFQNDFTKEHRHHEIYLSDPRKTAPEKWKTIIRHLVRALQHNILMEETHHMC